MEYAALYYPSKKAQQRLRDRVKKTLNAMAPVPIQEQVERTNRVLRGWVNYFRVGNSNAVFHDVGWFVEVRLRRVLQRKAKRCGCGWKRYDRDFIYRQLGLFSDYRIRWQSSS